MRVPFRARNLSLSLAPARDKYNHTHGAIHLLSVFFSDAAKREIRIRALLLTAARILRAKAK
jgi:hypothetical protein